jgi:hypothetical protein
MPAAYPQQQPTYQQGPPFYAPPVFNAPSVVPYQQPAGLPPFQQPVASAPNATVAKNKWKKKKNGGPPGQGVPPPQILLAQSQFPFVPAAALPSEGVFVPTGPSTDHLPSVVQTGGASDEPAVKPGKCWKCSVDTHATKDCKAQHYCLVCDIASHPTLRCPTLKLPKQQAFVAGPACEESLCLRLPDNVYKAHLAPKGLPTALIKITGGTASVEEIQSVLARICPLSSRWKWEAIPHGDDAFIVSFPTVKDLQRVDGFQLGVPNSNA